MVIDFEGLSATVGARDLRNNRDNRKETVIKTREHDIAHLFGQVETLRSRLEGLVNPVDREELIPIWKQPDWTTPAGFRPVAGALDAMVSLTGHLVEMKKTVVEGSRLVEVRG